MTVVLEVGARSFGHASLLTFTKICESDADAILDFSFSVIEYSGIFFNLIAGIRSQISLLSPDFYIAKIESFFCNMPRSPCNASAG